MSHTSLPWTATSSGAILVAAGLGPPAEHALISLLALNGLRVSEATGVDIEHLGLTRDPRGLPPAPLQAGALTGSSDRLQGRSCSNTAARL